MISRGETRAVRNRRFLARATRDRLARILLTPGTCAAPIGWAPYKEFSKMRRLSLALAGLFVLFVSATQAQAQTITLNANLSGGNEVPAVATGSAG
ncbi:MAG TPA: hypothetical protein VFZ31_16495, partial [Vicinamibacterales bacterium]